MWKDNKFDPSATLFEDEEQLKIFLMMENMKNFV